MQKDENSNNRIIYLDSFRDPGAETELTPIEMKQQDYRNLLVEIKKLEESLVEDEASLEKVKRQLAKLKSALKTIEFRISVLKKDNDILAYVDETVVVSHGKPKYIIKKGITDSSYEELRKLKKRKAIFKKAKAAKSTSSRTLHETISSETKILINFQSQLDEFKKDEIFMKSLEVEEIEATTEDVKIVASAEAAALGYANGCDLSLAEKVKVFFSNILEKIKSPFRKK